MAGHIPCGQPFGMEEHRGVTKKPKQEAPNVVTELQLRALLDQGFHLEVEALADAEIKQGVWRGEWIIRVFNHNRDQEYVLVTSRPADPTRAIEFRKIKTGYGIISFLKGIGRNCATIPLEAGKKAPAINL
jgi:hypothetical protein